MSICEIISSISLFDVLCFCIFSIIQSEYQLSFLSFFFEISDKVFKKIHLMINENHVMLSQKNNYSFILFFFYIYNLYYYELC